MIERAPPPPEFMVLCIAVFGVVFFGLLLISVVAGHWR